MVGLATWPSGWQQCLVAKGFFVARQVYSDDEVGETIRQLTDCLGSLPEDSASIRSRGGTIYAARNFIELFPYAAQIWDRSSLRKVLKQTLGPQCGLVRGLYFDKPPDQSWSLPWHRDLTIAVRDHRRVSTRFANPTLKAGVPHVEAPVEILDGMLTLRIHLDEATLENGALQVIPGSHRHAAAQEQDAQPVLAKAGDVLVMRPRLSHCSARSESTTKRHRRIIHLEFAASPQLSDGFEWYYFKPVFAREDSEVFSPRNRQASRQTTRG